MLVPTGAGFPYLCGKGVWRYLRMYKYRIVCTFSFCVSFSLKKMRYIYLYYDLKISSPLEVGKVELWSHVSLRKYINKALLVPGYGWIPCSKALSENFTNDPKHLVLIISEEDDPDKPVTSDKWITRTGIINSLGLENKNVNNKAVDPKIKIEAKTMTPNIKTYNRMSARALIISENAVLQFLEEPQKDKNGIVIRDKDGLPIQRITFVCGTKKGYVSPAAISIIKTGTIDDFQYVEVCINDKNPIPCILRALPKKND